VQKALLIAVTHVSAIRTVGLAAVPPIVIVGLPASAVTLHTEPAQAEVTNISARSLPAERIPLLAAVALIPVTVVPPKVGVPVIPKLVIQICDSDPPRFVVHILPCSSPSATLLITPVLTLNTLSVVPSNVPPLVTPNPPDRVQLADTSPSWRNISNS